MDQCLGKTMRYIPPYQIDTLGPNLAQNYVLVCPRVNFDILTQMALWRFKSQA